MRGRAIESGFVLLFPAVLLLLLLPIGYPASMELIRTGISGRLTSREIAVDGDGAGRALIGTSIGLYVFDSSRGTLEKYIRTPNPVNNVVLIDDVSGDGQRDFVISTADSYYPNVRSYDGASGGELWRYSPRSEIFDPYVLWTTQQNSVFDLGAIQDVDGDGKSDVVVTSGYLVSAVSGKTGREIWVFNNSDNPWRAVQTPDQDGDGIADLAVGDQRGWIILLSGASGEVVWKTQVSPKYAVIDTSRNSAVGSVDRSVWDIVPIGNGLAASAEDGAIHFIELATGKEKWKSQIVEYSDSQLYQYYGGDVRATGPSDYNFFNLRITAVVGADGKESLLATTYPGARAQDKFRGAQGIYLVDPSDGSVKWKNQNVDLNRIFSLESVSLDGAPGVRPVIPLSSSAGKERVGLVDLKDGEIFETIVLNVSAGSGTGSGSNPKYLVKGLGGKSGTGKFLVASDSGDLFLAGYSGQVSWSYSRIPSVEEIAADLVGDATPDIFIRSTDDSSGGKGGGSPSGKSRFLEVVDGKTGEIAWSYELPLETFVATGGLSSTTLGPDISRDGKPEIFAFIQYPGEWDKGDSFGDGSRVFAFDGRSGRILLNFSVTNETYYGIYDDIFRNESAMNASILAKIYEHAGATPLEMLDWTTDAKIVFLSTPPGNVLLEVNRTIGNIYQNAVDRKGDYRIRKSIASMDFVTDLNGDGLRDLLVGGWNEVFLIDSATGKELGRRTYRPENYQNPFNGSVPAGISWNFSRGERIRYVVVGDVNRDGRDDLASVSHNGILFLGSIPGSESGLDYAVSGNYTTAENFDTERVLPIGDVNGDRITDLIVPIWKQNGPQSSVILDGGSGRRIMELETDGAAFIPGTADLDGDGAKDSLVFKKWTPEGGVLEVIGGKSGKVIFTFKGFRETWIPTESFGYANLLPGAPVGDRNGDGVEDLAVARSSPWGTGAEIIIFDVKNAREIKRIMIEEKSEGGDNWMPAIDVAPVPDTNFDGKEDLGVIILLGSSSEKKAKVIIADLEAGTLLGDFVASGDKIITLGGDKLGVLSGSSIYLLDTARDLEILSPSRNAVIGSPVSLKWKSGSPEALGIISVDGKAVARTTEKQVSFEIPEGVHNISIYEVDSFGKGIYESVQVSVSKGHSAAYFATAFALLLVLLLFVPKVIRIL